jgi:hypothetical protein
MPLFRNRKKRSILIYTAVCLAYKTTDTVCRRRKKEAIVPLKNSSFQLWWRSKGKTTGYMPDGGGRLLQPNLPVHAVKFQFNFFWDLNIRQRGFCFLLQRYLPTDFAIKLNDSPRAMEIVWIHVPAFLGFIFFFFFIGGLHLRIRDRTLVNHRSQR